MKILSGVLVTRDHYEGQAKINLDDNSLAEAPQGVRIAGHIVIGSGRYTHRPCTMVSLWEIKIRMTHPHGTASHDRIESDSLRIDNISTDEHYMEIAWDASGGSKIEEISYMVIGQTP